MKRLNSGNGQGHPFPLIIAVLMLSKFLQCGTGRYVLLKRVSSRALIILVEVLYVARRPETASEKAKRIKNPKLWVRVVLFLCCVSPGTDNGQPST
jgi:hypothetical protein